MNQMPQPLLRVIVFAYPFRAPPFAEFPHSATTKHYRKRPLQPEPTSLHTPCQLAAGDQRHSHAKKRSIYIHMNTVCCCLQSYHQGTRIADHHLPVRIMCISVRIMCISCLCVKMHAQPTAPQQRCAQQHRARWWTTWPPAPPVPVRSSSAPPVFLDSHSHSLPLHRSIGQASYWFDTPSQSNAMRAYPHTRNQSTFPWPKPSDRIKPPTLRFRDTVFIWHAAIDLRSPTNPPGRHHEGIPRAHSRHRPLTTRRWCPYVHYQHGITTRDPVDELPCCLQSGCQGAALSTRHSPFNSSIHPTRGATPSYTSAHVQSPISPPMNGTHNHARRASGTAQMSYECTSRTSSTDGALRRMRLPSPVPSPCCHQ